MIWLLDANVLIALSDEEHLHHQRSALWFAAQSCFATCPITEGALARYLLRQGVDTATVQATVDWLHRHPDHQFWPGSLSYRSIDLTQVIGHRQATDAYLVSLVREHGPKAQLATLDEALAGLYQDAVTLIPEPPQS